PAGADSYLWNTGETTQSITVSTPGTYDVDVIPVTGPACAINLTKEVYEFIDTVQAVFSLSPDTICAGQSISFTESSTISGLGSINSWDWDFDGDGNVDVSTQNPTPQVYNTPGTYDVNLSVATTGCVDDTTIQVVVNPLSTANFTAPAVCLGDTTVFTDISTAGVDSWNWDFNNDGLIDNTTQNPKYLFLSEGTYPVNLEVSIGGACVKDTTIDIIVHPKPVADFVVNDTCLTLANQFNDNSNVSSGTITGWDWDFDNNGTVDNTTQNPTNTYGASGIQTIELVVTTNNTCRDTVTKTVEIFENPVAAFVSDTACEPFVSTMTDATVLGSIGIANWNWDFDANATIDNTNQNPTNTFGVAGSYPVTLNVTDSNGCVSSVTENVIIAPKPTAAFSFSDVCFGANTIFTNLSNGNGGTINAWAWDYTNNGVVNSTNQTPVGGYGYSSAGNYDAVLVVTTTQGCKDTVINVVDVDAIPVANYSAAAVCLGDVTQFYDSSVVANSNIVQWNWNFENDAIIDVNTQNPTHTYPAVGPFNASLNVVSDSGCFNTVIIPVDVNPNPIANFTTDTACLTSATTFTDVTTLGAVAIEFWEWDFDNNSTIDDGNQNPTFTFTPAGNYIVGLNVIDSLGCSHDTTLNVTVSENPFADFTFSDECFNENATSFTNLSHDNGGTTSIDTWSWDFDGDGIEDDNTQTPTNLFDSAGVYTTQLIVTSTLGCKDTAYVVVDVDAIPVANFGLENVCLNYAGTFTDSSTVAIDDVVQWSWNFGDGVGTSVLQNPTYTYTSA
ncbi:MAG: hypothetical protein KDD24_08870, partial [Flavobacteriales bacterium]|nr:hypothetical protein [Flavobacteriales bacterium]